MNDERGYLARKLKEGHASLFERTWPSWVGGMLVAFLSILMFAWERPWGVVAGMRNWGDWLFTSLGIYHKSVQSPLVNYASVMDLGLVFGAFASALLGREFSIRTPPRLEAAKGFVAGILMGIGAALARGCNVGGFYSAISALSLGGVAMMFGLILGAYVGLRYLLWELEKFPPRTTAPAGGERSEGGFDWRRIQPWIGYAIMILAVLVSFRYSSVAYTKSGGLLLLGLAVGIVMHRSRLCFVAAFRDPFMTGESRQTKAVALSLMIAMTGYAIIKWAGLRGEMVYVANTFLFGGLVGGFIFGIGMVIAGGCGSGTLWRVGEGQVKLWITLVSFSLTNALVRYYMDTTGLIHKVGKAVFIPDLLSYKWTVIALLVLLGLWYLAADWNEEKEIVVVE
jgi:hypothetical protein